jgi:hypothetical protein
MSYIQGNSRFHSRNKEVYQVPCQKQRGTAGSTLGTKGYNRLHARYTRIQQFSL